MVSFLSMLTVFSLLQVLFFASLMCAEKTDSKLVPALYVFGDSTIDSGNNNYLDTIVKANYSPYGIDFVDGPTGRFTNGKTIADHLALLLGLPFVPPYLGLMDSQERNITTGINFGSSSCGILPETKIDFCLPLENQTDLFQRTVVSYLPKEDLQHHLSKSIFLISLGENDYNLGYFNEKTGLKKKYSPDAFSEFLIDELLKRLQKLYDLGARKFLVNNISPIGCLPVVFNLFKPPGDCVEDMNEAVMLYNEKLPTMLQKLQSQLHGAVLTSANSFKFLSQVKANPTNYGIADTRHPCCLDDKNGTSACRRNSVPCKMRNKYMFFDISHTSQSLNELFVSLCFKGSSICTPLSVMDLVLA